MPNGKTYIGSSIRSFEAAPATPEYTGVRITYIDSDGNPASYLAGTEDGNILEFEFPWTGDLEDIAQSVLTQISGKSYSPYRASGAVLDIAAELGDAVILPDVYSVLASRSSSLYGLGAAEISAPWTDDGSNEFTAKGPITQSIEALTQASAMLKVGEESIEARVESAEGDISGLEIDVGGILAQVTDAQGNYTVLTMTANGIIVRGNSSGAVEINGGQLKAGTVTADSIKANSLISSPTIYSGEFYSGNAIAKLELDETFSSGYTYPALIFSSVGVDAHEVFRIDEIYPGSHLSGIERMLMFGDIVMSYWEGSSDFPGMLSINAPVLSLPGVVIANPDSFGTAEPPVTGKEQRGQLYFQLVGY